MWFADEGAGGWATCPITENGFVSVLSNPKYPGRRTTVADAAMRLTRLASTPAHHFWPDDVSLLDSSVLEVPHLGGHYEITDSYLLALALKNRGRLATFDRGVRTEAVVGAGSADVQILAAG